MIGDAITLQAAGFLLTGASLVTLGASCAGQAVRLGMGALAAAGVVVGVLAVDHSTRQLNLGSVQPPARVAVGVGCEGTPTGLAVALEEDMLPACAVVEGHALAASY